MKASFLEPETAGYSLSLWSDPVDLPAQIPHSLGQESAGQPRSCPVLDGRGGEVGWEVASALGPQHSCSWTSCGQGLLWLSGEAQVSFFSWFS